MKLLLPLLLSSLWLFEGNAQNGLISKYSYENSARYKMEVNKRIGATPRNDSDIVVHSPIELKGKKAGVYRLPQDGMPCIVPDSTKTANIPNAWKGPVKVPYKSNAPSIPNLSKPWVPFPIANSNVNTK